ncbi:MAG: cysteine hydrolase [Deltaproteobacteria bacterium]|nr:cysteine hydrolase [Deltaproteobacteria bacterium]
MAVSLKERVDPKQAVLVILDMQKGSWPPRSGRLGGQEILPELTSLIEAAREVRLPIIFVRNTHSEWTDTKSRIEQTEGIGVDYRTRYWEGTPGVDFLEGLKPEPSDLIFVKHSYSPYAHGPLDLVLKSRGIRTLLLTGGSVLGAVETVAKDSMVRGYNVVVVKDCVHPSSGPIHAMVVDYVNRHLGMAASSEEIMACWQA